MPVRAPRERRRVRPPHAQAIAFAFGAAGGLFGCASVHLLDDADAGAEPDALASVTDVPQAASGQGPPSRPPAAEPSAGLPAGQPAAPGSPPTPESEPPPSPESEPPPENAPAAPADPAAGGPCGDIDYFGECEGNVLRYCDEGTLAVWDCAWTGQACAWIDDATGYDCDGAGDPDVPPDEPAPAAPSPAPAGGCGTDVEARVVDLVNASRARLGLGALECDAAAVRAAQLHSQDQCDMGNMSHTGSDGSDAGERMRRAGGRFGGWGENVAYGATTPDEVHSLWMNSPGHYANIMGPFGRIGVGVAPCNGLYFWTEAFMD